MALPLLEDALLRYRETCKVPSPGHLSQLNLIAPFLALAAVGEPALLRSNSEAHFTGSVLITNPEMDSVLLTLHQKLGLWLQLGGHADGDADLARVALREGIEESGIGGLQQCQEIFDLDAHWIPERPGEPGHTHYDVRYIAVAPRNAPVIITPESKELRWFALPEAYGMTREWSMHRQFDKLECIRSKRGSL